MGVAMFAALLHVALHIRVWCWFRNAEAGTVNSSVKRYAVFNAVMNIFEALTWAVGIMAPSLPLAAQHLPDGGDWRKWVFLGGLIFNVRLPGAIMPNDFHSE